MPELPELEIIAIRMTEQFGGKTIKSTAVHNHLVIHGIEAHEFEAGVVGREFDSVEADGKFLLLKLSGDREIVINPMLAGRFWVYDVGRKPGKTDVFSLLIDDIVLWYRDRKQMSRVYLVQGNNYADVAGFGDRGLSPLDPALTLEEFKRRFKRRRGQIKN
ncbi:MAG: DNA-formamidopyrimidine glycosylase family protein, partial [Candidatus Thorarchaeota archaeon]